MKPERNVPRVVLIGISGYARIHLQLAREAAARGELVLRAAVVINPEEEAANVRALRAAGCVVYGDYREMLAAERGRVELCLIPTGIPWHARMAVAALAAGMNVLVEKPLAGSLRDADEILRMEHASGRFVAVGFQDIYAPVTQALQQRLLRGEIGRVQRVRFLGLWPRPPSYFARNDWSGRLASDGVPVLDSPLNNAFAHFVNLALYFASAKKGDVARASSVEAELWRANRIESFDTGVVRAVTREGVQLWLGATHACRATRDPEIEIEGSAGRVIWRHESECVIEPGGGREVVALDPTSEARRAMLAAVLARCGDPRVPVCTAEMARAHTELIEAVHEAAPIATVGAQAIDQCEVATGGERVRCVRGLESVLQRAFAEVALPRALSGETNPSLP